MSPYPYRVQIAIVDAKGNPIGRHTTACFNTLGQAKVAKEAASLTAYKLEPSDIEEEQV
jgi:hypothetical protein